MQFRKIIKIRYLNYKVRTNKKKFERAFNLFQKNSELLDQELQNINQIVKTTSFTLQKIREKSNNPYPTAENEFL